MTTGRVFAALYKNYASSCYLDCYLEWILFPFASMLVWQYMLFRVSDLVEVNAD